MGDKTVVKRQNIATLNRSKDILARYKRPETGFMHNLTEVIAWINSSGQKTKLVSKQWVQDSTKPQKNSNSHILI